MMENSDGEEMAFLPLFRQRLGYGGSIGPVEELFALISCFSFRLILNWAKLINSHLSKAHKSLTGPKPGPFLKFFLGFGYLYKWP